MHYYARSVPDLRSYRNELGTRPGKLGWLFARFVVLGSMARITELPNVLTSDIDKCDSSGIVRLLRQSDAQLFAGWGDYPCVNDTEMLDKIDRLASRAATLLQENHVQGGGNMIVFSGCGTSGRMAWLCSCAYNRLLSVIGVAPCFHYLIAGGDQSLVISNELPEDNPPQGAKDLETLTRNAKHAMFFGISCGLSAPYVAGQVDYAMNKPGYTTVLVGFNPVCLARDAPIEQWHQTCKKTFLDLENLSKTSNAAVILNPVIGPEPITGSSRMKGGSMTGILLDTIMIVALSRAFGIPLNSMLSGASLTASHEVPPTQLTAGLLACHPEKPVEHTDGHDAVGSGCVLDGGASGTSFEYFVHSSLSEVATVIDAFSVVYNAAYRPSDGVSSLISLASTCLLHPDGHLYYLGATKFGALGLVDGSEMVDTYGSTIDEIRGFVVDGWVACENQQGDLSYKGQPFRISLQHFSEDILPHLTDHDCVICIESPQPCSSLRDTMDRSSIHAEDLSVLSSPAKCALLAVGKSVSNPPNSRYTTTVSIKLPHDNIFSAEPIFAGFAVKLILNAISTGANILKGRVFGNTMINLTVANNKLFERSVDIISEMSGASKVDSTTALLKAIHRGEDIDKYESMRVSSHIMAATKQNMVIPLAVLLASGRCSTVIEALQVLGTAESLRTTLQNTVMSVK